VTAGDTSRQAISGIHDPTTRRLPGQPAADIIAFTGSIVALRRSDLRRRSAPGEIGDGMVAFILRALAFPEGGHHASAPVARA
jgi:hypothetical protein